MEHPSPPVALAHPHAGLVRLQNAAAEQAGADQAGLLGKSRPAVIENVDQGPFADRKPQQVGHQSRQPLERDRMGKAQIDREGPQVRPERRARRQVGWRVGPEPLAAARADPAVQRHLRHVGLDLGDLDAVVGVNRPLPDARHVRPAMPALCGQHVALARRIRMQWAVRPGMRLALGPRRGFLAALLPTRRRRARVVRCLRRQLQLRPQLRIFLFQRVKPFAQLVDPSQQRRDQRILLGARQRGRIKWQSHP